MGRLFRLLDCDGHRDYCARGDTSVDCSKLGGVSALRLLVNRDLDWFKCPWCGHPNNLPRRGEGFKCKNCGAHP